MTLNWKKESEDEYQCVYGFYSMEISRWGRSNWAWKVKFKGEEIAESQVFGNVRNLKSAKEKCRYQGEKHEKEIMDKIQSVFFEH